MRRIITRTTTTQTTVIWTISWSDAESPGPKPLRPFSLAPRRKATLRFGAQSRWRKRSDQ